MKILILADTHWGVRGDNPHFYEYQKKFFERVVFPYIEKFGIRVVVHLGDLVDNRKSLNYQTLVRMRSDFLDPLSLLKVDSHWIPGNHDAYYRNTLSINAMNEFVKIGKVYNDFETITIDGSNFSIVPWMCSDAHGESIRRIRESTAQYCFGHLELVGFPNNNGLASTGGDNRATFNQFDKVLSGHFHKQSRQDNIVYVGSAFQFTWSDYGDYRGMSVFDTTTGASRYFRNPFHIFSMVEYEQLNGQLSEEIKTQIKNTYCRLVVRGSDRPSQSVFNDTIKRIEDVGVINLTVDDSSAMIHHSPETPQQGESLHSLITRHIQSLKLPNSENIEKKFNELYTRAENK